MSATLEQESIVTISSHRQIRKTGSQGCNQVSQTAARLGKQPEAVKDNRLLGSIPRGCGVEAWNCYGLNVCVLPKFTWWSRNSQCDDIWMSGLWEVIRLHWGREGGAVMMGLAALQERERREDASCLLPSLLLSPSPAQPEKRFCEDLMSDRSQEEESSSLACRPVELWESLWFKPLSLRHFVTAVWADQDRNGPKDSA